MGIVNIEREEARISGEDTFYYESIKKETRHYLVDIYGDGSKVIRLNHKFTDLDEDTKSFVIPNWYAVKLELI